MTCELIPRVDDFDPLVREIGLQHDLQDAREAERGIGRAHRRRFAEDEKANGALRLVRRYQTGFRLRERLLLIMPAETHIGGEDAVLVARDEEGGRIPRAAQE